MVLRPIDLFAPRALPSTIPEELVCDEIRVLRTVRKGESVYHNFQGSNEQRLQKLLNEYEVIDLDHNEKVKAYIEEGEKNAAWSLVLRIMSYITAAASIVFGLAAAAVPGASVYVAGGMIAAGVVSITNIILQDTGMWTSLSKSLSKDTETQGELAFWMPTAVGITTLIINAFCAYYAIATLYSLSLTLTAAEIVRRGLDVATGVAVVGSNVTQAKFIAKSAELTRSKARFDEQDFKLKDGMRDLKRRTELKREVDEQAAQFIQNRTALKITT